MTIGGNKLKKTVLIVDDAPFMRASLKEILESNGYRVVGAVNSGKKAIRLFKHLHSIDETPDITLMDITMKEGMNGLEALKRIKTIDENALVIMCSSIKSKPTLLKAIQMGAVDYVSKPFEDTDVLKAIGRALKKRSF